jgi:hypothetical protein
VKSEKFATAIDIFIKNLVVKEKMRIFAALL